MRTNILAVLAFLLLMVTVASSTDLKTDITGKPDFPLGVPLSDVDVSGMFSVDIDDSHSMYLRPSVYKFGDESVEVIEMVIIDSRVNEKGVVGGVGLGIMKEGNLMPGGKEFKYYCEMAGNMKAELLAEYDPVLVSIDEVTDSRFEFRMNDSDGDVVAIVVDADGLAFGFFTKEVYTHSTGNEIGDPAGAQPVDEVADEDPGTDEEQVYRVKNKYRDLEMVVHSFDEQDSLKNKTKKGAKFVIVEVTVTNTSIKPYSFSPDSSFRLVDSKGRQFKTDIDGIIGLDDYILGRELSPDIPEWGRLAYMVPLDSTGWRIEQIED